MDINKDENEVPVLPAEGKLEECEKKCEEYLNGWKRAKADFINYKNEENKHLADIAKYTRHNYIYSLLPMLDNLELTVRQMPPELRENSHVKGLLMVKIQLEDYLKTNGAEAIASVGEKFDPNLHEVAQAVDAPEAESGTVVEEVQKGYMIDGNLLRPAKVKVAK
ncbi:MAG: nucleotide exchange factor GrpE [Candidatus Pacebacteria bacterium]|jgi:molecular chaperone GrpE|nr:nucleotide exchange factor GrpE [Candidatus Paceibacterota bacterium]